VGEFRFEAITILVILLPGFLAARIEQRLVVNPKQNEFDKTVEALLYSFFIYLGISQSRNRWKCITLFFRRKCEPTCHAPCYSCSARCTHGVCQQPRLLREII
jgi:hypothetical protein